MLQNQTRVEQRELTVSHLDRRPAAFIRIRQNVRRLPAQAKAATRQGAEDDPNEGKKKSTPFGVGSKDCRIDRKLRKYQESTETVTFLA